MDAMQAAVLGLIQGLAEFLPISSSGHLVLAEAALGIQEGSLLLAVLLHVGTLVAVFAVFWRDWWEMLRHPLKSRLLWMLALATLPAAALGALMSKSIDKAFSDPSAHWFVGIFFLCTAAMLLLAERFARRPVPSGRHARKHDASDVNAVQTLSMGGMQAIAILPGISRSGSTIAGGMLSGLNRAAAAKFSFMMSAPIILGSMIFECRALMKEGFDSAFSGGWTAPLVGVLAAAASGYLSIRWMLRLVQRVSLRWFALYTGVLGAAVLADHFVFHLVV